jgi:hypothetical protein
VKEETIDTHSKALKINLDPRWYGTFAEIGAGQEVVRWFFRAGGARRTIAKSISAYDEVSDAIYGRRNVMSRGRLQAMLDQEFDLDVERLARIAAITLLLRLCRYGGGAKLPWRQRIPGWMSQIPGRVRDEPNQIVMHVPMLDAEASLQQALGIVGVNLAGAFS